MMPPGTTGDLAILPQNGSLEVTDEAGCYRQLSASTGRLARRNAAKRSLPLSRRLISRDRICGLLTWAVQKTLVRGPNFGNPKGIVR